MHKAIQVALLQAEFRIHIAVVDLGDEAHFGRLEGIVRRKVHIQKEHSARIRRVWWTSDHCLPVEQVFTNLCAQ